MTRLAQRTFSKTVSLLWTLFSAFTTVLYHCCHFLIFSFLFLFGPLASHNSFSPFETYIFSDLRRFFGVSMVVIYFPSIHPSAAPAPAPVLSCSPNSHRNFVSPTHLHADKSFSTLSSPSFVMHVCTVKQLVFFFSSPLLFFSLFDCLESFPFDPSSKALYVLVQKSLKTV